MPLFNPIRPCPGTRTVLATLLLGITASTVQAAIPLTERQALIDLYNALDLKDNFYTSWVDSSGALLPSGTECYWDNVLCEIPRGVYSDADYQALPNHVIGLGPHSILDGISSLQSEVGAKSIIGPMGQHFAVPASITQLTSLKYLNLNMSGVASLPNLSTLPQLQVLEVANSNLTGPIPDWLAACPKLSFLNLGFNALTGPIPDGITRLSLTGLWLGSNNLTGDVPQDLMKMTTLASVRLSNNGLYADDDSLASWIMQREHPNLQAVGKPFAYYQVQDAMDLSIVPFDASADTRTGPAQSIRVQWTEQSGAAPVLLFASSTDHSLAVITKQSDFHRPTAPTDPLFEPAGPQQYRVSRLQPNAQYVFKVVTERSGADPAALPVDLRAGTLSLSGVSLISDGSRANEVSFGTGTTIPETVPTTAAPAATSTPSSSASSGGGGGGGALGLTSLGLGWLIRRRAKGLSAS